MVLTDRVAPVGTLCVAVAEFFANVTSFSPSSDAATIAPDSLTLTVTVSAFAVEPVRVRVNTAASPSVRSRSLPGTTATIVTVGSSSSVMVTVAGWTSNPARSR